ncbi:MAG: ATP-binding protein [Cellulosilyticaceae bacterium]
MKIKHLLSYTRRAIQDYNMIENGDRIAVGISAGKDSLALLVSLTQLRHFYPKKFEIEAVTVSLGFDSFDLTHVIEFCKALNVPYTVYETEIAKIIFEDRKESNPCSLCSNLRKGALYDKAKQLNCNKIALGHNRDDINETLLMSLFYAGQIHTMAPVKYHEKVDLTIIRPLIYVPEKDIKYFAKKENLPVVKSPCPADGHTKRETTKQLIYQLGKEIPDIQSRLFGAVERSQIEGWQSKEL